ncbi:MAG: Tim44-like domain-containing protein [Clostridium sp.]
MKFLKKKRSIIAIVVILLMITPLTVFARPGGGKGGFSGGSKGGFVAPKSHSSSYSNSYRRGGFFFGSPFGRIMSGIAMFSLGGVALVGGGLYLASRGVFRGGKRNSGGGNNYSQGGGNPNINNFKREDNGFNNPSNVIGIASNEGSSWRHDDLKNRASDVFYGYATGWMNRDLNFSREYLSERYFEEVNSKLQWMSVRGEVNILKDYKLLNLTPVSVVDRPGDNDDVVWILVEASSIDYTINEKTNQVIDGDQRYPNSYSEYWRFIKERGNWVLDDIRQIHEASPDNLS